MANRILPPNAQRPELKETGEANDDVRVWRQQIANRLPILGEGNPEGVLQAERGATYYDMDGSTGAIIYIKIQSDIGGDKSQGWVIA